jgi:DNA repair exonuclease SbcCD nuclease subunit
MTANDITGGDIVLVHTSDLHVDDDPRPGTYTGLQGMRTVLATAAALGADYLLLAGDTFDNPRISTAKLREAADVLATAAMPVVMLPGNHDPAMPDCLFRRARIVEIPHVHVLGITHGERVAFAAHDLEICGRAHRDYCDMAPLPAPWARLARWQVVMAHGHYVPPEDWEDQAHRAWKISDADIAASGADYIALGHWDRATPAGAGPVPAFYSGAPDLARSVNVIRLAEGRGTDVRRAPLQGI